MIRLSDALPGTQLNSVWMEAVLETDPVDLPIRPPACRFRVRLSRPVPPDPPSVFLVEASESALDGCRSRLTRGRTVRIIGRLHQLRWRDVAGCPREEVKIVSELIEPISVGF